MSSVPLLVYTRADRILTKTGIDLATLSSQEAIPGELEKNNVYQRSAFSCKGRIKDAGTDMRSQCTPTRSLIHTQAHLLPMCSLLTAGIP